MDNTFIRHNRWLYTPRGCAIFYVPFRNQHLIRSTLPTSHGFQALARNDNDDSPSVAQDRGRFGELFQWAATVDQTPYLCIPEAVKFRINICGGEARIRKYCFNLAQVGGQILANKLGTELLRISPDERGQCCFTNLRLPLLFRQPEASSMEVQGGLDAADGPKVVKWIMDRALCEFNTWIPVNFYNGAAWVRISAQIYLEMKDFKWAGAVLQGLCERVSKDEWRS